MNNPLDFTGRVVLVTGGGRGVGRGIADGFAAAGAVVVICGRTEPEGAPHEFVAADVRDPDQVGALVDAVVQRHGRLDIAVNNAGGSPWSMAADASPNFSEKIIALNLIAPLHVATRANAVMQAQDGGGVVVNIGSVSGTRPSPGTAAYGAAKAGLHSLTETLAVEWAPTVRVNAVIAGFVRTEQSHLHYGDEAGIGRVAATVPMGRFAQPSDVAAACLWLASPAASYVTGAHITLDGGGEWPVYQAAARDEPPWST